MRNFTRCFVWLWTATLIGACGPTVTKHVRVQRHVDRKPSSPFQRPLNKETILSKFGERGGSFHTGLDLRGRRGGGDFAYASRAGRVVAVGWVRGYGQLVEIKHADGYKSRYAHLKKAKVKLGESVKEREPIGIVGRTGRASTAHLHFEIITPDGYFIDPLLLLP